MTSIVIVPKSTQNHLCSWRKKPPWIFNPQQASNCQAKPTSLWHCHMAVVTITTWFIAVSQMGTGLLKTGDGHSGKILSESENEPFSGTFALYECAADSSSA